MLYKQLQAVSESAGDGGAAFQRLQKVQHAVNRLAQAQGETVTGSQLGSQLARDLIEQLEDLRQRVALAVARLPVLPVAKSGIKHCGSYFTGEKLALKRTASSVPDPTSVAHHKRGESQKLSRFQARASRTLNQAKMKITQPAQECQLRAAPRSGLGIRCKRL